MKNDQGFTVVELLVTLIVGMLLMFSTYQLYNYVLDTSSDTRMRATASALAYEFMRENAAQATNPCTPKAISPAPTIPASANLAAATAGVKITCLVSGPTNLSIITSSITFGSPYITITHATYVKTQ